jgi:hypothetical protein
MQRLSQSPLTSGTWSAARRENRGDLSAMQAKISCSLRDLLHENFILRDGIPRGVWQFEIGWGRPSGNFTGAGSDAG